MASLGLSDRLLPDEPALSRRPRSQRTPKAKTHFLVDAVVLRTKSTLLLAAVTAVTLSILALLGVPVFQAERLLAGAGSASDEGGFSSFPASALSNGTDVKTCQENYGLLPCSTSVSGNLFLMVAYGYLVLIAAKLISEGSEHLLQVLDPGIIGGLVLPILGAMPDTLLIAMSGVRGTKEEAQVEVLVGMGVLAGSTVMILTLAWGGSLLCGRCDFEENSKGELVAKDKTLTRPYDFFTTGVTTDEQTRWGAWIMIASMVPYVIMQIPVVYGHPEKDQLASLIGLVLSVGGLIVYCTYQVLSPWYQNSRIANARLLYIHSLVLHDMHRFALQQTFGNLMDHRGEGDEETLRKIFHHFDSDDSNHLSKEELKALVLGLKVPDMSDIPEDEEIAQWMMEFDTNEDGEIGPDEFVSGMRKWLSHVRSSFPPRQISQSSAPLTTSVLRTVRLEESAHNAKRQLDLLEEGTNEAGEEEEEKGEGNGEGEAERVKTPLEIYREAILLILGGAVLVGIFADPVVGSIGAFSEASHIPAFFVAFVVSPLVSNASELVSSLIFALRKRKRCISLTYSQVYGAISMNNTLCLGTFLALVYFRGLTWQFSAEVTIIFLITLIVGFVGGSSRTFPSWMAFPILALYPISVATIAFLDYVLGWS